MFGDDFCCSMIASTSAEEGHSISNTIRVSRSNGLRRPAGVQGEISQLSVRQGREDCFGRAVSRLRGW